MRGKHQRRQRRRRDLALTVQLEQLRTELEVETLRAEQATQRAITTRMARSRLAREQEVAERRLRGSERLADQLVVNATRGGEAVATAMRELRAVNRELSAFRGHAVLQQDLQAGLKARFLGVHRTAQPAFVKTWFRAHTGEELTMTRDVSLAGWTPDDVPAESEFLAPYATATVLDTSPEACWTWAIPPWLALPEDTTDAAELRTQLGTTGTGRPSLIADAYPHLLRPGATITSPWRHPPIIGHPSDAIDLAHWYHRSAFAQRWHPEQRPVPFWLPPEHATSYPQAQPLPEGTGLRLPHPLIFVSLASPWNLKPRPGGAFAELQPLLMYARGRAARGAPEALADVLGRLQATNVTHRSQLPTPLELLDAYGGTVEGLLITANPDGTPADEFAWCLAVYHPSGLPLARLTMPASRAKTQWRQQLDNVIAGIALSRWHDQPTRHPTSIGAPSEGELELEGIHVLDIDATSPHSTRRDNRQNPARSSRPHLRRGYWRRQRVGHRRQEARWTWVRATTVNAAFVSPNQVYTLRPT